MALLYMLRILNIKIVKSIICVGLAFYFLNKLHLAIFLKRRYDTWAWDRCPGFSPFDKLCTASRASIAQDVQVVVKTGGSEPQNRLQYQLATVLSNIPPENILLFSDLEENVGSFHIHDVYAGISEQERTSYPEFALYDQLQAYQQQKKDTRTLAGGWDLAKYMNLAMKWKIWEMLQKTDNAHLRRKWFVFIDTDTFVEWDNMLAFLEHFDARQKLYMGSPVWLPKLQFAHGGSGYIVSYGALEALNVPSQGRHEGPVDSQFGLNTTALCCGDEALAMVFKQRGIKLRGYWPMFNGETPATVRFGEEVWCDPVISLHHISGTDMEDLWQWVESWKARTMSTRPLLFKDLFEYIAPRFVRKIEDWDNTEEGSKIYRHKDSFTSFEQCEAACEEDKLCFQFVFHGAECTLSHEFRLGRERLAKNKGVEQYISGWDLKRIQDWTLETKCTDAHWVRSNP